MIAHLIAFALFAFIIIVVVAFVVVFIVVVAVFSIECAKVKFICASFSA